MTDDGRERAGSAGGSAIPARPQAWRFGRARLDERTLELRVDGELVALERRPLQVLRALLRRAGEVVSHDELLAAVWPGRSPSSSVLKKCVSQLRDALHDADQTIVKTVHGFGYRLVAPVEAEAVTPSLEATRIGTRLVDEAHDIDTPVAVLVLHHAGKALRVEDSGRPFFVGRDPGCGLCVPDPEPRVSSRHLMIDRSAGRWMLQDISRNGTHLRDDRTGETLLLPYGVRTVLPARGTLCLGRAFAGDPAGRYTVRFEPG
ncbi:MAG TPA: winged helix-turn-helix domain-containing protein [Nevskiaceae bacterium]|nr:winged helix-turn-helix domain-containing protein [Nevskiaceae bacterium]